MQVGLNVRASTRDSDVMGTCSRFRIRPTGPERARIDRKPRPGDTLFMEHEPGPQRLVPTLASRSRQGVAASAAAYCARFGQVINLAPRAAWGLAGLTASAAARVNELLVLTNRRTAALLWR